MLDKKDVIIVGMTLLFALSAIFSAISMEYDSKANNELVFSLLEFSKADYISAEQSLNSFLITQSSLNENNELARTDWICSVGLLYMESPNPDQQLLNEFIKLCLGNMTQIQKYQTFKEREWNNSMQLRDLYNSIQPLQNLNSSLEDYISYSKNARIYKYVSWVLFLFGFLIFYFYFLEYLFRRKQ